MYKHLLFPFVFWVLIIGGSSSLTAQFADWDYQIYPERPFTTEHLDAELRVSETGSVEGDLLYTIRFLDEEVDSLVFDAAGLEIRQIALDDEDSEFYLQNDRLIIYTGRETTTDDEATLRIQYRGEPRFGLHQSAKGTFWSSNLPKTTSHWLVTPDHPRVEFTLDMVVTHAPGMTIVTQGRPGGTEVESVDEEVTTFSSGNPVSPAGLTLVFGDLERMASTQDTAFTGEGSEHFQRRSDAHIHIYSERSDDDLAEELLSKAVQAYSEMTDETGKAYPFRDLSIIVLEDDAWETKAYGQGTLYLFENRGDLTSQVRAGVRSQWLGAWVREEQWADAGAVQLLQALGADERTDDVYSPDLPSDPYARFDEAGQEEWRYYLDQPEAEQLRRVAERIYSRVFDDEKRILSWDAFARLMYEESGRTMFEPVRPAGPDDEEEQENGIIEYLVSMDWDESEQQVEFQFQALGDPVEELVTVRVDEITFREQKQHELTFTGENDTVVMNVDAGVENIKLSVPGREDLELIEEKPFSFWIHQLREDDDTDRRRKAARALSGFSDNPDLQLVLTDLSGVEDDPEVYAEIVRSLAAITAGASGMEQTFIDRSSDQQPHVVRLAAVEGMAYFGGNDRIIARLEMVIERAEDSDLRRTAIRSLNEVTEADRFRSSVERLMTDESVLPDVPMMLRLLAERDEQEAAVQLSETFIAEGFPYDIRAEALSLILEHDRSREGWENRLEDLLIDRDPRIRFQAAGALERLGETERREVLERFLPEEYDERVRRALSEYDSAP